MLREQDDDCVSDFWDRGLRAAPVPDTAAGCSSVFNPQKPKEEDRRRTTDRRQDDASPKESRGPLRSEE